MPKVNVKMPDGRLHELEVPEGMSREQVKSFVYEKFPEYQQKKEQKMGLLEKAGEMAQKYVIDPVESARLPEISGGLLQGLVRGAESLANVPLGLASKATGKDLTLPYVDFQKYLKQDPTSRAAFLGGEIGGSILPGAVAYKGLSSALSNVMRPSLATESLAGAGAGYLTGGSEDDRTRYLSAALGGALPVAHSLSKKVIASRVTKAENQLSKQFNERYNDFFNKLENSGLQDNKINLSNALKDEELINNLFAGNRKYQKPINDLLRNPTFKNAHEAQAELRKLKNVLQLSADTALRTKQAIPKDTIDKIGLADQLRKRLRGSMQQFLLKNEKPELLENYIDITKDYRDKLAPYINKALARYKQGKTRPAKFVRELLREEDFMKPKGAYKDIPGLGTLSSLDDSFLQQMLSKALEGTALATGASVAYQLGAPSVGRIIQRAEN